MRRRGALALLGAAMLSLATAAAAQNGAMWVDRYGRMTTLTMPGESTPAPSPVDRTPAAMAALFHQLCVAGSGDPAGAGLAATPFTMGGRRPEVLDIWHGAGVVLSRSERFFVTQKAQCNAVFYVNALPEPPAVYDAVSAALGAQPSNAARATKRNGQPNRSYVPEWSIGTAQIGVAHVSRGNRSLAGDRVHLSVRSR